MKKPPPLYSEVFGRAVMKFLPEDRAPVIMKFQTDLNTIKSLEAQILAQVDPIKRKRVDRKLKALFEHYLDTITQAEVVSDELLPQIIELLQTIKTNLDKRLAVN